MRYLLNTKAILKTLLVVTVLFVTTTMSLFLGYRRGYQHAERVTNKWWIDQQSQYYDVSEVEKKRRASLYDHI